MATVIANVFTKALSQAFTSYIVDSVVQSVGGIFGLTSNEDEVFSTGLVRGLEATADADSPQSYYDRPINIAFGVTRLTANLIWASDIERKEITTIVDINTLVDPELGVQTTGHEVKVDRDIVSFAMLLCEGPISGIKRMWFNHELVYEARAWSDAKIRYKTAQFDFDIHDGSEAQQPSAVIQSFEGASDTPGYRGLAYLVFKDIDITLLGGRIPIVQVEVSGIGQGYQVKSFTSYYPETEVSAPAVYEALPPDEDGNERWSLARGTVTSIYTESGDIKPMQFDAVNYPVPVFMIVNYLIQRTGLAAHYFDTTQLSRTITGYTITNKQPIKKDISRLASTISAVSAEQDRAIVFKQTPQPISKKTDDENCIINEFGLTVNSLHDIQGRDGYFSSSSGTSEGQFTAISACCLAYFATSDISWKTRAEFLAAALEPYLYGTPIPTVATTYIPHWLFNVKRPIQAETTIIAYPVKAVDHGTYLEAVIPEGAFGMYAEKIKRVDRAIRQSAIYLWENPESQVINFSYLPINTQTLVHKTWYAKREADLLPGVYNIEIDGETVYVVYGYTKKTQLTTAELNIRESYYQQGTGYVVQVDKPPDYRLEVDDKIVLTFTLTEVGEWIGVGEKYEAWPAWRKLEDGELDGAADSFYWASDAYMLLNQMTGEQKWLDAFNANKHTIVETHDIDDARDFIKPQPSSSAYSQGGSFSRSEREGFGRYGWTRRRSDGFIQARIPKGEGEVSFGRGASDSWRTVNDTLDVTMSATGLPQKLYVWIDTDLVFNQDTRYYAQIVNPSSVIETFSLYNSDFKTILDPLNESRQLTVGSEIKAVGISLFDNKSCNIVLERIRPLPLIALPYTPYAPVYTINVLNGILVDWRGVPGPGYTFPHVWHDIGIDTGMRTQTQFLKTAQQEYASQLATATGPLIHAYYWDRSDNAVYGTPGTWGFNWVDPNSQWGGYQYRCLQSTAIAAFNAVDPDAITVASNFIGWLNDNWTDANKFPPTDYPGGLPVWQPNTKYKRGAYNAEIDVIRPQISNGFVYLPKADGVSGSTPPVFPPTLYAEVADGTIIWECTGYQYQEAYGNYNEPHAVALFMRAALYCSLANINKAKADALLKRGYDYLEANYQGSGEMAGSWSSNGDWWLFWHAEIIITLSKILMDGSLLITPLGMSSTTITTWINESNQFLERYTRKV